MNLKAMEDLPANIKEITADLIDTDKPLVNAKLVDLSNLNTGELKSWSEAWAGIDVNRRRLIVNRLVELAEDNFELNFDSIFKNCLKDTDAEIRVKAIEGLWENEEFTLITPFIKMLNEDRSEAVQAAAAKALSKYAMLAELKKLGASSSSRVSQALLAILSDKNKPREVWRRALEAAAPLSLPEVRRAIDEAYKSSDPKLRNSAIYAMGRNCAASWMPILLKEMLNPDADVRYEAAGACGEICDDEAVPHLIKLTRDKDSEVQRVAVASLGKIGGVKAKQHLLKCQNSADEIVSEAAEQALKLMDMEEDSFIL
jgi:HEAT repeat protein